MAITGKIKTLFEDAANTIAIFPRTKTKAITDDSGTGLDALLSNINTNISSNLSKANNAQTKADSAYTLANTAKSTADTAKSTADSANSLASTAKTTADTAVAYSTGTATRTTDIATSGSITWRKYGRVVEVYLNNVKIDITKITSEFTAYIIANNLPKSVGTNRFPLALDYSSVVNIVSVDTSGVLRLHIRSELPTRTETAITSSFTYICA